MSDLKYPLHVMSRLRLETDGIGVTTLVTSVGCPLSCKYCINPETWKGNIKKTELSVEELYEKVKIDNLYFLTTGGGLTFGGGEPLLHAEFLREFITKYKETSWKFYLETSLSVPWEKISMVAELFDAFLIDCKDMNEEIYRNYAGGDVTLFKSNLAKLIDLVGPEKIKVRIPLIKDYNTEDDRDRSEEELRKMGVLFIDRFEYIIR